MNGAETQPEPPDAAPRRGLFDAVDDTIRRDPCLPQSISRRRDRASVDDEPHRQISHLEEATFGHELESGAVRPTNEVLNGVCAGNKLAGSWS
jgi:hypothetical protein